MDSIIVIIIFFFYQNNFKHHGVAKGVTCNKHHLFEMKNKQVFRLLLNETANFLRILNICTAPVKIQTIDRYKISWNLSEEIIILMA